MADQLFGCKCKERLPFASPPPSPPAAHLHQNKTKEQNKAGAVQNVSTLFESVSLHLLYLLAY